MPVNFYFVPCGNPHGNCQSETVLCLQNILVDIFSIDDTNGAKSIPAKVNISNPNPSTDFIVENRSDIPVFFKAVDWCVQIFRTGTYNLTDVNRNYTQFSSDNINSQRRGLIKRCEGFIQYNNRIVFIEIKNRRSQRGDWIEDSREKFEETILSFKEHHPQLASLIVKPILANPAFIGPHPNEAIQKKILKDKIGVEFLRADKITI